MPSRQAERRPDCRATDDIAVTTVAPASAGDRGTSFHQHRAADAESPDHRLKPVPLDRVHGFSAMDAISCPGIT
jgi:hypothetical protein